MMEDEKRGRIEWKSKVMEEEGSSRKRKMTGRKRCKNVTRRGKEGRSRLMEEGEMRKKGG